MTVPVPPRGGISLRAVAPNVVTAMALCSGLTAIRYGIAGDWERAIMMVILAGVLDGLDGRIARMLRGESRFGAELDSLSDVIAFGVAPAIVMFLWSLDQQPKWGWLFALAHVVSAALRLARFNSQIDLAEHPRKAAGFLTGVPAPAGAGMAMLPMYLWIVTDLAWFRAPIVVGLWMAAVAVLMISSIPTFSWSSLRLRRTIRLEAIALNALLFGALLSAPWITLSVVTVGYTLLIPFAVMSYARVIRARGATGA